MNNLVPFGKSKYVKIASIFLLVSYLFILRKESFFIFIWEPAWVGFCVANLLMLLLAAFKNPLLGFIGQLSNWVLIYIVSIKFLFLIEPLWLSAVVEYVSIAIVTLSLVFLYLLAWLNSGIAKSFYEKFAFSCSASFITYWAISTYMMSAVS